MDEESRLIENDSGLSIFSSAAPSQSVESCNQTWINICLPHIDPVLVNGQQNDR